MAQADRNRGTELRQKFLSLVLGFSMLITSGENVDAEPSSDRCWEPEFVEVCLQNFDSFEKIEELVAEKDWWLSRGTSESLKKRKKLVVGSLRLTKNGGWSSNKPTRGYYFDKIEWSDTTFLSCHTDYHSMIINGTPTNCDRSFPYINSYVPKTTSIGQQDDKTTWSYADGPWRVQIKATEAGKFTYFYVQKTKLPDQ